MIRIPIPGGWYCEALPSGEFAVLMPTGVRTHDRFIPASPHGLPLYVRITTVGGFKLAGQASAAFGTLVWDGSWTLDPRIANGTSGCIWDRSGQLHIIEPGPHVTSQGYRYVAPDGRLVLGDATYGPWNGLNEYTDIGDGLVIGQGNPGGGIRVWDGHVLRLLEPGACRFIRANRDGDYVTIAAWVEGVGAVLHWLTVAELRTLPVVDVLLPVDPVDPTDPDIPMPTTYVPVPSQIDTVRAVWDRCTPAQRAHHAFVAEQTAWELRKQGLDYYVNQKRGTQGDSEDAISTPHPMGAGGWAIIDIIADFGGDNPQPAWIDQTQATIDGGTVGGGRLPRNLLGSGDPDPVDPVDPPLTPKPEHAEVQKHLTAAGMAVLAAQRALREIPEPKPKDCPPCELPHGGGPLPVSSEPEMQQIAAEWDAAFGQRAIPRGDFALLMWQLWSGEKTRAEVLEEAKRRGR